MPTVLDTFNKWKEFLGDKVDQAQASGMSDDMITNLAYEIGKFLDERVDPKNDQQRTLKELWDVGTEEERKTLARLMVKLVDRT